MSGLSAGSEASSPGTRSPSLLSTLRFKWRKRQASSSCSCVPSVSGSTAGSSTGPMPAASTAGASADSDRLTSVMVKSPRVLVPICITRGRAGRYPWRCARSTYGPGGSVRKVNRPSWSDTANADSEPMADTTAPTSALPPPS